MIGRIFRVLSGFILACLAAGLVKVLFAFSPAELSNLPPEIAGDRLALAMPIATHTAIFAAPFALIAIWLGEWRVWRDWTYYAIAAMAIAMVGFFAQYSSETTQMGWSIFNSNYPLVAFLSTGFVSGVVYWLFSGRLAGHHLLTAHRHGLGGHGHGQTANTTSTLKAATTTTVRNTGNGNTNRR
jgi:hypothetical protein